MTDWIGDPDMSREEKLARFNALGPEPTTGPRSTSEMHMPLARECSSIGTNFAHANFYQLPAPDSIATIMPGARTAATAARA